MFLDGMETDEHKQLLRSEAKTARDALCDRGADAAQMAASYEAILALSARPAPVVSGYLPIGSELDPVPLMTELAANGASLALPVMVAKAHPLQFRAWQRGRALIQRQWGIREPGPECAVVMPDILLVPLLLVDGAGFRLGYGGGFYDRTLAALRQTKEIVAIGVGYDSQRVDTVPIGPYDQPLDFILAPSGLEAVPLVGRE